MGAKDKKGKYHGKGKLTQSNGSYYEGNFVHGIKHGHGVFLD